MTTLIRVMPMIGQINREERLDSLRACHAIHERQITKRCDRPEFLNTQIGEAIRELLLADRVTALSGKVQFIVTIEVL